MVARQAHKGARETRAAWARREREADQRQLKTATSQVRFRSAITCYTAYETFYMSQALPISTCLSV